MTQTHNTHKSSFSTLNWFRLQISGLGIKLSCLVIEGITKTDHQGYTFQGSFIDHSLSTLLVIS